MNKPTCILIIDDEPDILDALRDILSSFDYDVLIAEKPSIALDIVSRKQVDVVICDINMPEMDGIEVLKRLKAERPLLQVIMITAFSTMEKIQACLEAGAADYLLKPLADMEEALNIVEEAAKRVRRWRKNFLTTMKHSREVTAVDG